MADSDIDATTTSLETALNNCDDPRVRYHIRQAAQLLLTSEWERTDRAEETG